MRNEDQIFKITDAVFYELEAGREVVINFADRWFWNIKKQGSKYQVNEDLVTFARINHDLIEVLSNTATIAQTTQGEQII